MTKKFKSLSLFLILGLLISNFSCQVDEAIVEKENIDKKNDFIIKHIESNEIQKNKILANKIQNLKNSLSDFKSKTVYNSEFDFYIDTEQALYVQSNDSLYHSYTFQINRTTPSNNLENLFLSLQADGSYKSYIVTYNVTEQEKNQIYNNVQVNLENKVSYLEIDNTSMQNDIFARETKVCIYVVTTSCSQGNHVDGYLDGAECPAHQFTVTQFCTSTTGSGGTSSGDYSGEDGSLGGSPGTGSGGGGNSNDPVTTPVYVKQPWEKIQDCLGLEWSLNNSSTLAWLQNHKTQAGQISNFLEANQCNEQASAFAKEAAIAMEEGGEVDFVDGVILHHTITSNQKLKCVYDKLKSNNNNVFNNIINNHFDSSKSANIRFEVGTTPNGEDAITIPYIANASDVNSTSNYKIILNVNIINNLSTLEVAFLYIHESIHAELIERCFRLGLINVVQNNNGNVEISFNNIPTNVFTIQDAIFSQLILQYYNYNGGNSQWNHDIFNGFNHRNQIAENLLDAHQLLNVTSYDFLTNINNDTYNFYGNFTLAEVMSLISWIGLEDTQEYNNHFQNNSLELTKKNYIENAMRVLFTNNCN